MRENTRDYSTTSSNTFSNLQKLTAMKGKLIAHGTTGMFGMMDMCYKHGWNYDNTIMEHDGDEWWIYEKINN